MIGIFKTIAYIISTLLITVAFHEAAHMVVALLCKVKVEAFSLGFGKILLHKKLWNIDFRLSAIPLGGYCRLEGEKGKTKTGWLTKRYSKKLAIILAGVTANLLIAFLCYWINYKSIKLGLYVDYKLLTSIFTKDHLTIYVLVATLQPNLFILQLGLMNIFACATNLLPIPALDGGFVWLLPLERIYKEKFPEFLEKITKIGFIVLMILQFALLYWIWCA